MAASVTLHVFRSARRHLADARHCDALRRASPIPSVQENAKQAFARTVDALVFELEQLEQLGAMDRIEGFLEESEQT